MNAALLVAPDFLLIALGVLLARRFAYGAPFWEGVERLVYFVLFPALLFRSLATAPLAIGDAGALALTALGYTGGAMVLSALARPLFALPRETFAACFQCGFRFNTYLVLAVASSLGGAKAVALASLVVGIMVPVVNVAAVAVLARGHAARIALEVARNPLVLATLAGIAWNALALPMPRVPARMLELAGNGALPLGLLAVGAALRFEARRAPAARARVVPRGQARRHARDRAGARAGAGAHDGRDAGRARARLGPDRDVGLHPRRAHERARSAGRADRLDRHAARGVHDADLDRLGGPGNRCVTPRRAQARVDGHAERAPGMDDRPASTGDRARRACRPAPGYCR